MDKDAIQKISNHCTRFVGGHYRLTVHQMLSELVEATGPEVRSDLYGQGELIANFERQVAELLGKEAAVFMPSGTMAQQIALRLWSDRRRTPNVAFHPTCHLEIHEQKGYQMLHGLHGVLIGSPHALLTLDDLKRVSEPLAALLLELPQREIGGQLPSWPELIEITDWARAQDIPLHMDGARLWECKPFYKREYAEIAGLFDTVYVSFYKGLGGIAGAILAGPADFIAEARIWQRRHGGNLVRLFPYVLSAQQGLNQRLPRMSRYHAKAIEIAAALSPLAQIELLPNPPQTNMLHVFLRGDKDQLEAAALNIAQMTRVWLFNLPLAPSPLPGYHKFELSVGDATLELTTNEIAALFRTLFEQAEAIQAQPLPQ
jgi:threonine aldolase